MMDNGFSSPRNDSFPAGLRVLVVDDDPTWLKILEKMLKKCSYEVTTCGLARDALTLLREKKDGYDIVISDVYMPDMDGFKLLELVGLEMDLPVIMMSVDGETSRVMKGVQHGACDYLLKPIRMKELRNIWQHVFRKKIQEVRDIENFEGIDGVQVIRNGIDHSDDGHFIYGEDQTSAKKRKDIGNKDDDKDLGDNSSTKKARVVWSVDLHQKFVKAVHQIGFDKVGPKKILDLMNVPWLTRENVASHLQKYRLYLSRLQKENNVKNSVGGIKHSDLPSRVVTRNFCIQNPINMQHKDVSNGSYGYSSGSGLLGRNVDPRNHDNDRKQIVSNPVAEPKRVMTIDVPVPLKPRISPMERYHSLISTESEVNYAAMGSTFPSRYSQSEIPKIQMKQELKPPHLDDKFHRLPLIQAENLQSAPSVCSMASVIEEDTGGIVKVKTFYDEYKNNVNHTCSTENAVLPRTGETKTRTANHQVVEPSFTNTSTMKNQGFNWSRVAGLDSEQKNNICEISSFVALDKDLQDCWIQDDCFAANNGIQNIEFPEYCDSGLISDFPIHLYDALRFEYENLYDPTEYSLTF